jgi:hypothetical protein
VDDYVNAGSGESLNITDKITIEVWIKPTVMGSYNTIVAKGRGPLDYAYFCGIGTAYNNSLSLQLGNVGAIQTGNIAIQMNTWSHVVGVRSGNIMSTYINGRLSYQITNALTGTIRSNTIPAEIGRYTGGYFNGLIDDVRLYNRALSDAEIKALYDATK